MKKTNEVVKEIKKAVKKAKTVVAKKKTLIDETNKYIMSKCSECGKTMKKLVSKSEQRRLAIQKPKK